MASYGALDPHSNGVDTSVTASGSEPDVDLNDTDLEKTGLVGTPPTQEKVLSMFSLVAMIFFLVCGGSYGTEDLAGAIPPLYAILGILIIPWLFSLPISLMTAELATAMPDKGGFFVWIQTGWGEFFSILDAVIVTFVVIMDQALYPIIYLGYIKQLLPDLEYFEGYGFCIAFIVLGCIINLLGVGIVGQGSKIFAMITLTPFLLFCITGWASGKFDASRWFSTEGNFENLALYLSVLLWANCGYEYSGFLAGDVREPKKIFPRSMFVAVTISLLTYLLPVSVAVGVAGADMEITEGAYPEIADYMGKGSWLRYMLTIGALASNFGTYTAYLTTSAQSLYSLALEGKLPEFMTLTLPKFKTPVVCVLFYSISTCALVLLDFSIIVETESVLYCLHVIILFSAFVRLRFTHPDMIRPYQVPGGKIVAFLFAGFPIAVACLNIGASHWLQWVICASVCVGIALIYGSVKLIKWLRSTNKCPACCSGRR